MSGKRITAVMPIARASRKPIRMEQPTRNKNEDVKYPNIKINITWIITAMETKNGFHVKKSNLIAIGFWTLFFNKISNINKNDKKIILPKRNNGNNSPPAGNPKLIMPKKIDEQIKNNAVKIVDIFDGRMICT